MIEGSVVGTLVRLILSLAMVLTLMAFLARYLRHRQLGGGTGGGMGGIGAAQRRRKPLPLEVVTRQGLSRGSSVAVVRVSGQLLLLGVTESTVSVLRELEDLEDLEAVSTTQLTQETQEPQETQDSPAPVRVPTGRYHPVGSVVEMMRQWTVRRG